MKFSASGPGFERIATGLIKIKFGEMHRNIFSSGESSDPELCDGKV